MYAEPTKIICVGRNYLLHARELNNDVPEEPIFFLKPPSSAIRNGQSIVLPRGAGRVDFEAELGVVISDRAVRIPKAEAFDHVLGYVVCNDVTAREMQDRAKRSGQPWTVCKGYDTFFPMSEMKPAREVSDPGQLDIELRLNGERRQRGNTRNMIFPIERLISDISQVMTLERGDIIATGTPSGVGQLHPGDKVVISIGSVGTLSSNVTGS